MPPHVSYKTTSVGPAFVGYTHTLPERAAVSAQPLQSTNTSTHQPVSREVMQRVRRDAFLLDRAPHLLADESWQLTVGSRVGDWECLVQDGLQKGIVITKHGFLSRHQIAYIRGVLSLLPESVFKEKCFKRIHLNYRPSASTHYMWGMCLGRDIYIFPETMRDHIKLLGIIIHEIGHNAASHYLRHGEKKCILSDRSNSLDYPIPFDVCQQMKNDFDLIRADQSKYPERKNVVFALNWLEGWQGRLQYTSQGPYSFHEFIAESHTHYVIAGEKLSTHIGRIADLDQRDAYRRIYNELRERIFGGVQYTRAVPFLVHTARKVA